MRVVVTSHESSMAHDTGPHHPERPQRVDAVRLGIEASGLDVLDVESPRIERSELAVVHDVTYIEMVEDFCATGGGALDMDTFASEDSWEAALRSAGAVKEAIERLRQEDDAVGFALTRPPGHHASAGRAMGFCLFNNVALAAKLIRAEGETVAILDWDVHHGNGTQDLVGPDPGILYTSIHQSPFYPFDGLASDIDAESKGTVVNIPVPAGTAGDVYRRAWSEIVLPVVSQFRPDWVLVSAGFDAHVDDMLANLRLEAVDYGWMAARLSEIHPVNRTVLALEGGYDLYALRDSTSSTLRGLAGAQQEQSAGLTSPAAASDALEQAAAVISRHWKLG